MGLIVLNITVLAMVFSRRPHLPPERKRDIVIEKLHLSESQIGQYDQIIQLHRSQINNLEAKIHTAKSQLYLQLLRNEPNNKVKDSLIGVLSNYHEEVERTHFGHFESLKKICTDTQLPEFNALTEELADLFSRPQMPPHQR